MGDMAVMVLALPAMEVMVLDMDMVDTVSTRDPLMPTMEATDMGVMDVDTDMVDTVARDLLMPFTDVDMEVMVDTAVDTEVTEDTDMAVDTDTKFCFLYNKLPLILISSHYSY